MNKGSADEKNGRIVWDRLCPVSVPQMSWRLANVNGDGQYIFESFDGETSLLNRTAGEILSLCDGTNTLRDISARVSALYPGSTAVVYSQIRSCMEELESIGLVRIAAKESVNQKVLLNTHWIGRFGNRMHQYAYSAQFAKTNNMALWTISDWEGSYLFKNQHHELVPDLELRRELVNAGLEPDPNARFSVLRKYCENSSYSFDVLDPTDSQSCWIGKSSVAFDNLPAYDKHIFQSISAEFLLSEVFEFSDDVKSMDMYKKLEDIQGSYDVAHLRRGDLLTKTRQDITHSVVSRESYQEAFKKFGVNPHNVVWVSDDPAFRSANQSSIKEFGWSYPEGSEYRQECMFDWLEDFLTLYFARTVMRSNSAFSFWACFLSQQRECPAIVFSPKMDKFMPHWDENAPDEGTRYEFVEGNHSHWMSLPDKTLPDIIFSD